LGAAAGGGAASGVSVAEAVGEVVWLELGEGVALDDAEVDPVGTGSSGAVTISVEHATEAAATAPNTKSTPNGRDERTIDMEAPRVKKRPRADRHGERRT
jgi:hypothetical protein